jgi:arylsulfatase
VHGDHGEAFGEHGTYGHQQRLYEENIHVPLVVHGGPDRRVENAFSLENVPWLLLDLAAGEEPTVETDLARTQTLGGERAAIRGRDWKYLQSPEEDAVYTLSADPDEQEPLRNSEINRLCRPLTTCWRQSDREKHCVEHAVEQFRGKL